MAIKFAFSTVACPDWSIRQAVEKAKAMGYQGVELRTFAPAGRIDQPFACDPAKENLSEVRGLFASEGIVPVCLSTSLRFDGLDDRTLKHQREQAVSALESARALGCPYVRFFGSAIPAKKREAYVINRIARAVAPLAEQARAMGLTVLLENTADMPTCRAWWQVMNLIDSPSVKVMLNTAVARLSGDDIPAAIPLLHSRIGVLKAKDVELAPAPAYRMIGEGQVNFPVAVRRLMGIGYDGYVSVEWDRLWVPSLTPAQEYLPQALARLRGYLEEVARAAEASKPKPKPEKPAVKPAAAKPAAK